MSTSIQDTLLDFQRKLTICRYSKSTCSSYLFMFKEFIKYHQPLPPDSLTIDQISNYHSHLIKSKNISVSYQNQSINAIKFYFEKVLGNSRQVYELERPMKASKLPLVLSKDEIANILRNVSNLKHKTILTTIYSAGLRISEVINLTINDIDSDNMRIWVRSGKGNKDRITILSPKLLELLRIYYRQYRPIKWLFEGPEDNQYSPTSIRKILHRAKHKAGISKPATVHTLRHNFATHLLENGTNLRYIQQLLGHTSSRTTEIYTHVATGDLSKVISPLDGLDENKSIFGR